MSAIWLHTLGVSVVAQHHNPSILNKDFLMHRGIVPESWQAVETVTTSAISGISYDNGVQWMMNQNRLVIIEPCNRPFEQNEDSLIHERASLYVETLPHTPYNAMSLNYTASIICKEPGIWITQQFLNKAFCNPELVMQPKFTINMDDATLDIGFRAGNVSRHDGSHEGIMIDCDINYQRQFDSATLKNKICGWKNGRDMIYSRLRTMLGVH